LAPVVTNAVADDFIIVTPFLVEKYLSGGSLFNAAIRS
jgi:hypothetical protein